MNRLDGALPMPLSDVLGHVSGQMRTLRDQSKVMEDAIAQALAFYGARRSSDVQAFQGLDRIVQTLGEISKYLDLVAAELDETSNPTIDVGPALRQVSLRDLATQLSAEDAVSAAEVVERLRGEVDLF